nr:hypothetical protein T15B7.9 - Caenorhabditis elegans [Caenorhabditis elegans]
MIFLSVVCYFLSVFNVIDADCAPGDVKNTQENCVHVENLAATWQEAENFCTAHNGHLASVHNAFDMTSLRKVAGVCSSFWLGGQCQKGSNCNWIDGTSFDYSNFRNGNSGTDNCIVADTKSGIFLISLLLSFELRLVLLCLEYIIRKRQNFEKKSVRKIFFGDRQKIFKKLFVENSRFFIQKPAVDRTSGAAPGFWS